MAFKSILLAVTTLVLSTNTSAALVTNTTLAFDAGTTCPANTYCIVPGIYGSYFGLDNNGNGVLEDIEKTFMTPGYDGGIILGQTQPADGVILPAIYPPLNGIDDPWAFYNGVGWHETSSPVNVVNDLGVTKELDFSGWNMNTSLPGYNFMLGGDTMLGDTGLATITCETSNCANGELFLLDYTAHIPSGDPSGFGGMLYNLHLEGTISAVPVPAAIWLFGSGLLGLIGFARRKKTQKLN